MALHSACRICCTRLFGALGCIALFTSQLVAQKLYPDPFTANPAEGEANVPREIGKKGLLLPFIYRNAGNANSNDGFPLDVSAATVMLTFGATTLSCTQGTGPPVGQCRFSVVTGGDDLPNDTFFDHVKIVYNGDFDPALDVTYSVAGAKTCVYPPTNPSCPTSAVAQDAPNISDNDVQFTTGDNAPLPGRTTASVELVFDISGSMGWGAVPSRDQPTRLDVLKGASDVFFSLLPPYVIPGDKIGLVYFGSNSTVFDPTAGGTNLESATNTAKVGQIRSDIQARSPTDGTSIGGGLRSANEKGFANDPTPNLRKAILLFSDGEQNSPPCVGEATTFPCSGTLDNTMRVNAANYPADITVCPITAGQQTAPGFLLQGQIGKIACANKHLHIRDDQTGLAYADMESFFTQFFTDVFPGDKLEIAADIVDTLATGTPKSHRFLVNAHDVAMTVLLSSRAFRKMPTLSLKAPNGTVVDLSRHSATGGTGVRSATLRLPFTQGGARIQPRGEWEAVVGDTTAGSGVQYHLMVLLDNMTLASDFRVGGEDLGTGEPIPIRATLTDGGKPVVGATVAAQLDGPQNGMGNVLSTTQTPQGTPDAGGDQFTSDADKKLSLLLADSSHASLFRDKTLPTVALLDNGQAGNGDSAAGDGVYSGLFGGATQEGHYHFAVNARGPSTVNGNFQRTRRLVTFVRPKPNPGNTQVTVVSSTPQSDGTEVVVLKAVPKDNFGNYVGPGYIGYLNIAMPSGQATVETPLKDNLDGSYTISYRVPSAQSNPPVTLQVMGDTVISKTLNDLKVSLPVRVVSLHAGITAPHGNLSGAFNSSLSLGANFEYRFTQRWSAEGYLGYDRFSAQGGGDALSLFHLSALGKATFGVGALRPAVDAGVGVYFAGGAGSGTHFGWTVGAGVQYWFRSKLAVEASYNYRNVSGGDWIFSTIQAGVRLGF